jgi:hypothetical protein
MREITFFFGVDGTCQHILSDSVLNSSFLGKRKISRVSQICFCEKAQKFYIEFLKSPLKEQWPNGIYCSPLEEKATGEISPAFFDTYEQAVKEEIRVINAARKHGVIIED